MTPRIIPMSLAIALTLAGPAHAKGITSVQACGASGCADVTGAHHRDWRAFDFGSTTTSAPSGAAFYRVTIGAEHGESWSFLFAPSAGKARLPDEPGTYRWLALSPLTVQRLRLMMGDIAPYPADRLAKTVDAGVAGAQVVETYAPAREAGGGVDDGSGAWSLAVVAVLVALALGAAALGLRRRGRRTARSAV